jgi:fumarate reductase subunit D
MSRGLAPFLWILFAVGGMVSAMLFPVHIVLFGLAFPMGWLDPPGYGYLRSLLDHPATRIYLFVFVSFPLFHWAHRFRYTLYDGLQLYHLYTFIAVLCYGGALAGTAAAAYLLLSIP